MTMQQAQKRLELQLHPLYDDREAANIADLVMEKSTGLRKIDRVLRRHEPMDEAAAESLEQFTTELLTGRPVQYVVHEAWFCGMRFFVDEHVLIPRPETEELAEWIAADLSGDDPCPSGVAPSILDVGTGSGCIPVALKRRLPQSRVIACDISPEALVIARGNADAQGTPIEFYETDFLDRARWVGFPPVDVLISNPPYVPLKDKASMSPNVVGFEPHLALFVTDDDPLIHYRALAAFARERMPGKGKPEKSRPQNGRSEKGRIYVEVHEDLAGSVTGIFREAGLRGISVRRDMQGKERMIKATW